MKRSTKRTYRQPQLTREGFDRLTYGLTFDHDGWYARTLKRALRNASGSRQMTVGMRGVLGLCVRAGKDFQGATNDLASLAFPVGST